MRARTVLVKDEAGRWKLSVTLPGGRYQLSLDDAAVNLLRHQVGLVEGEAVPDPFVPVLVATRDAWFPKETDTESVVESLPSGGELSAGERSALAEYVRSVRVNPRDADLVRRVVEDSPVSDVVDVDDLNVASLPDVPDDVDLGGGEPGLAADEDGAAEASTTADQVDAEREPAQPDTAEEEAPTAALQRIPGIGETRAESLAAGGFEAPAAVADARPADVAEVAGLSEGMATVAVEGARELLGHERSTAERLADETGVDAGTFEAALSALAASGVPPSEAAPVLALQYGPSLVEVDGVSGREAYFLWEAGYRTPGDLASADPADLEEVRYVGAKTAPGIVEAARELVALEG